VIEQLICSEPLPQPWEVGEALAECLLQERHHSIWPWNSGRDRRTPKASLPGADLVGFYEVSGGATFLFGEVKTSNDRETPPQVLYGRSGMIAQLENLATRIDIHYSLIKWLRPRCRGTPFWPLYQNAMQRYAASNGKDFLLVGCLMRDTPPDERDLGGRGRALARIVENPSIARLHAWYLPVPIRKWLTLLDVDEGKSSG
jgi:hypothetical protein